jgi:hypothetical protein
MHYCFTSTFQTCKWIVGHCVHLFSNASRISDCIVSNGKMLLSNELKDIKESDYFLFHVSFRHIPVGRDLEIYGNLSWCNL